MSAAGVSPPGVDSLGCRRSRAHRRGRVERCRRGRIVTRDGIAPRMAITGQLSPKRGKVRARQPGAASSSELWKLSRCPLELKAWRCQRSPCGTNTAAFLPSNGRSFDRRRDHVPGHRPCLDTRYRRLARSTVAGMPRRAGVACARCGLRGARAIPGGCRRDRGVVVGRPVGASSATSCLVAQRALPVHDVGLASVGCYFARAGRAAEDLTVGDVGPAETALHSRRVADRGNRGHRRKWLGVAVARTERQRTARRPSAAAGPPARRSARRDSPSCWSRRRWFECLATTRCRPRSWSTRYRPSRLGSCRAIRDAAWPFFGGRPAPERKEFGGIPELLPMDALHCSLSMRPTQIAAMAVIVDAKVPRPKRSTPPWPMPRAMEILAERMSARCRAVRPAEASTARPLGRSRLRASVRSGHALAANTGYALVHEDDIRIICT